MCLKDEHSKSKHIYYVGWVLPQKECGVAFSLTLDICTLEFNNLVRAIKTFLTRLVHMCELWEEELAASKTFLEKKAIITKCSLVPRTRQITPTPSPNRFVP